MPKGFKGFQKNKLNPNYNGKLTKGRKLSKKHKLKISKFQKGRKHSEEWNKKISEAKKGKPRSEETKKKIKETSLRLGCNKGEKNPNWKGGLDFIKEIRNSIEYKNWRIEILKRDYFTCLNCGKIGGKLKVHHIYPFADYPELRFNIDNGVVLCEECHNLIHFADENIENI